MTASYVERMKAYRASSAVASAPRQGKPPPVDTSYSRHRELQAALDRYYEDCKTSAAAKRFRGPRLKDYCARTAWTIARASGRFSDYPAFQRPAEHFVYEESTMSKKRHRKAASNPRRRRARANPRRRNKRAAAENPRKRRKAAANPRRRKARSNPRRRKARSNPRRRHRKASDNPRRRKARSNPRRRKARSNPRRRRRAAAAENPRPRRRKARSNPRRRRRAAAAENPRRRRARSNPRRRRRAAAAENPKRRRARSNPRRRHHKHVATNPRRRRARSNPHESFTEILSAVAASGAGYLAADLWHRFANTYDPAAATQPTDRFVGGDGSAANAKNIALPPNWLSMGGQVVLAAAPFLIAHYGKVRQVHAKAALQGAGIGAGAHLFGQIVTDFVLVKALKNNAIISRLFPQELKAQADAEGKNYQVSGTLGGHPPLIEELHTMFPHVPKQLLHSYGVGYGPPGVGAPPTGVGYGPSYDAGPYSLQPHQLGHHGHHGLSAPPPPPPGAPPAGHPHHHGHHGPPPPPPPPPGAAVTPFAPPPPPGGAAIPPQPLIAESAPGINVQLAAPCPTPDSRRANMREMFDTARRELGQQCESLGLGRLPHQMNPDQDARDRMD
jgi:hypothetical protein